MPTRTPPETPLAGFALEEIRSLPKLEALRRDWQALWQRAVAATPFQSPDWLLAWARHLLIGEPWVLAVRLGERLIGLAPFCIFREGDDGRRRVILMGTGVSDYLDTLAEPGFESTVSAMIYNHLDARGDAWDHADFQQLRPSSPLLAIDFGPTRHAPVDLQEQCPSLDTEPDGGWPVPPSFIQRLRYDERRLRRQGRLEFVTIGERDFDRAFESLLQLHGARWRRRGETGVLSHACVERFHEEAARALLKRGVLRLHLARDGDRAIACFYGFHHRRRTYYYLGGFDPAYEKHGAGNLIVWHALRRAAEEGATTFDFLRGQEPYKYRWGAVDHPTFRRQLVCERSVC